MEAAPEAVEEEEVERKPRRKLKPLFSDEQVEEPQEQQVEEDGG